MTRKKSPAARLIACMEDFISATHIPVRLALEADSEFEISIRRLATSPDYLREGHASEVMAELVRQADRLDVVIGLEALPEDQDDPDDDIDLDSLVGFYRKFGFSGEFSPGDESCWMGRNPCESNPSNTLKSA